MKRKNVVQVRNPKTKRYVKIDKGRKKIVSSRKKSYKGVPKG